MWALREISLNIGGHFGEYTRKVYVHFGYFKRYTFSFAETLPSLGCKLCPRLNASEHTTPFLNTLPP